MPDDNERQNTARSDFLAALRKWSRSEGDEEEGPMLQAAIPVLRLIHRRCTDEAEERAMGIAIRALGDTLAGTVWPSLRPKEGRVHTRNERTAIEIAVMYIACVEAGIFVDVFGDPRETVRTTYGVTDRTARRWPKAAKENGYIDSLRTCLSRATRCGGGSASG
jgi:hypothetical protein